MEEAKIQSFTDMNWTKIVPQYRLIEDSSTGNMDLGEDTDKLNIQ
jgi:hypothetical protein